jgi:hypothetical protein
MNELYIKGVYVYFKTNATNYEDAEREFDEACEKVGIEISGGYDGVLRNENGEDID